MNVKRIGKLILFAIVFINSVATQAHAKSNNCFLLGHKILDRVLNRPEHIKQTRGLLVYNDDPIQQVEKFTKLVDARDWWTQFGRRGRSIYDMREEAVKKKFLSLMQLSNTSEIMTQFSNFISNTDRTYFLALALKRQFEGFKEVRRLLTNSEYVDDVKKFFAVLDGLRNQISRNELIHEEIFPIVFKNLKGEVSDDEVLAAVYKKFSWLKDKNIELKRDFQILKQQFSTMGDISANCGEGSACELMFKQTSKLYSFDFSSLPLGADEKFFTWIDNWMKDLEAKITHKAVQLYRDKVEYVSIRKLVDSYFEDDLLKNSEALYQLGKSASDKMDRIDEMRALLLSKEESNYTSFLEKYRLFRDDFANDPVVTQFPDLGNKAKDQVLESFNHSYYKVKAASVRYKFTPRFGVDDEGVFGFDIVLRSPGAMFKINDEFPASKIKVLKEAVRGEAVMALFNLFPDQVLQDLVRKIVRIPRRMRSAATGGWGLLTTKESISQTEKFLTRLIDEKRILRTYPVIDKIVYGVGEFDAKYKLFLETISQDNMGLNFAEIFARRADPEASTMYDQLFLKLKNDVDNLPKLEGPSGEVTMHPYRTALKQMEDGRKALINGTLSPWFEDPPTSARYYRVALSGLVGIGLYAGGSALYGYLYPSDDIEIREITDEIDSETIELTLEAAEDEGLMDSVPTEVIEATEIEETE